VVGDVIKDFSSDEVVFFGYALKIGWIEQKLSITFSKVFARVSAGVSGDILLNAMSLCDPFFLNHATYYCVIHIMAELVK